MSDYTHKPGSGSIFDNSERQASNPNAPRWTGKVCLLDGTLLEVSVWEKETQAGQQFFSISMRDAATRPSGGPPKGSSAVRRFPPKGSQPEMSDEDFPF